VQRRTLKNCHPSRRREVAFLLTQNLICGAGDLLFVFRNTNGDFSQKNSRFPAPPKKSAAGLECLEAARGMTVLIRMTLIKKQ
jgi:hypothetical protein